MKPKDSLNEWMKSDRLCVKCRQNNDGRWICIEAHGRGVPADNCFGDEKCTPLDYIDCAFKD